MSFFIIIFFPTGKGGGAQVIAPSFPWRSLATAHPLQQETIRCVWLIF